MSVTEQDRERARKLVWGPYRNESDETDRIAAALADERDRARAPFLAAIEEIELDAAGEATLPDGAAFAAALTHAALRIRRAAEDPQ